MLPASNSATVAAVTTAPVPPEIKRRPRAVFTEPPGKPSDDIGRYFPAHLSLREALHGFMSGFLAARKADDDVHRLAFSITGLAIQMFISRDVIAALHLKLIASP